MADRRVGTVRDAPDLLAMLAIYPGDRLGGGPRTLPNGIGSSWGPADASQVGGSYRVVYRRQLPGGGAAYLALIDGPPERESSWEAWRVDLDFGSPETAEQQVKKSESRDRFATWALAGLGVLVLVLTLNRR